MLRNSTSFPLEITTKLKELYNIYTLDKKWNSILKYYQYIVNNILLNPDYEIKDSRGLLIYFTMGMGKTRTAVSIMANLTRPTNVFVILPKSLEKNFKDEIRFIEHELSISIKHNVNFISLDAYNAAKQLEKHDTSLDNSLIIIDEAHNFCKSIISGSDKSNAQRMYNQIMRAKKIKIVMLTGTPISKDPFELVPYVNLLSGKDILPIYYNQFNELYVDEKNSKIKNKEYLANRLLGLISYSTISTELNHMFPQELPMIVSYVEMSKRQYIKYLSAREKEEREKHSFFKSSKEHMLAIPKQPSFNSYYIVSRSLSNYLSPSHDTDITEDNSPKFALITERIMKLQGLAIVYSQFVNTHGLKQLTYFLQKKGFTEFTDHSSIHGESLKYALYTGDTPTKTRSKILSVYNSDSNKYGAIIKVLLLSKTGAEGLNLKNVRETHQIEPYWDYARTEQLKSRAIRYGSHLALPIAEQNVQPYIYIATANKEIRDKLNESEREKKTIDEIFYERALYKHKINLTFNDLLKEVAIECSYFQFTDKCYVCNPTNKRLFSDDPHKDLKLSNPCIEYKEEEKLANKITLDNIEYYYSLHPLTIYKYEKSLNGYIEIDNQDIIDSISKIVNKDIAY